MMQIKNAFEIEDVVYLKTDPDQRVRIVTAIKVQKGGLLSYELSHNTFVSYHYAFEISTTKDYSLGG